MDRWSDGKNDKYRWVPHLNTERFIRCHHKPVSHTEEIWGQCFQLGIQSTFLDSSKILLICSVVCTFLAPSFQLYKMLFSTEHKEAHFRNVSENNFLPNASKHFDYKCALHVSVLKGVCGRVNSRNENEQKPCMILTACNFEICRCFKVSEVHSSSDNDNMIV